VPGQRLLRIPAEVLRQFVQVGDESPGERGQDRQAEGLLRMLGQRARRILRMLADRQGREPLDHPGRRHHRRPLARRQARQTRPGFGQVADHLCARRLGLRQQFGRSL
jgi:hypothetical protein